MNETHYGPTFIYCCFYRESTDSWVRVANGTVKPGEVVGTHLDGGFVFDHFESDLVRESINESV